MPSHRWRLGSVLPWAALVLLAFSAVNAFAVDVGSEYDKKIKASQNVGALGNDLAGDRVNFYTGGTEFSATDVSLPGNSGLSVAVGRRYAVETYHNRAEVTDGKYYPSSIASVKLQAFGDWELDIPYLTGLFDQTKGWQIDSTMPTNRCSVIGQVTSYGTAAGGTPPVIDTTLTDFSPEDYWHGYSLHLPGGDQSLLVASLPNVNRPAIGGPYHWLTNQNWWFSCLSTLKNANSINVGEGFLAISPDGSKYTFDWLSRRNTTSVSERVDKSGTGGGPFIDQFVFRADYFLLPTKIEDRFGNWVQYSYSNDAFAKLLSITANDGRTISLTYNSQGFVDTISDSTRTWKYAYNNGSLSQVTLPDNSSWQYSLANLNTLSTSLAYPEKYSYEYCWANGTFNWDCYGMPAQQLSGTPTGHVIHPSGARVDFTFALHFQQGSYAAYSYPLGLSQKTLSGPGISNATWRYAFAPSVSTGQSQCASGACPTKVWTDEVAPDDSVTRRLYSTVQGQDETLLMGELQGTMVTTVTEEEETPVVKNGKMAEVYDEPSPVSSTVPVFYRQTDFSYIPAANATNFVYQLGDNPLSDGQTYVSEHAVPQIQRLTTLQDTTFTWQVNASNGVYSFDAYANPTKITRSSSLGYSRSESTEYAYNTSKWVLGQVAKVTDVGTGKAISQTTFDATTALPLQTYRFGLLQQTLTYNADGTLATVKDGLNNTTTLSNWYRGLPRLITYPDSSTQSATVSNDGQPLTVTDALGYTTTYAYDALGRVKQITPPSGDSVAWNPTIRSFVPVTSSEYGIPAGHWKQTVSTGNGRTTTYYDAQWRPVLTLTEDTGNAATKSFVVKRYDSLGRDSFTSYPVSSLTSVNDSLTGTRTFYDALGRATKTEQDSELGILTTTTEYLTNFQTRSTNPRGQVSTTSYQAFDVPSTEAPISQSLPAGINVSISRDSLGKPLTVTRSGPSG